MDRNPIYDFKSVKELDAWVTEHKMSYDNDAELSLRRTALLAEELLHKNNKCHICENKTFKHNTINYKNQHNSSLS